MNNRYLALVAISTGLLLAGCYTPDGQPDRTANGALAGGALGAATGAIIGSASHNAAAGAVIGGAFGAVTGAIIGNSINQAERDRLRLQAPQTLVRVEQGQPLGIADVKALAKSGLSDEIIISQIRNSHSVFHLSTAEIIDLKDAGVGQQVIDFMINTASFATVQTLEPGTVVMQAPPQTVYQDVIYPAPGPDYVWIGGYWTWYDGRWCWARGHWAYPPYWHATWVGGYWAPRGGSYIWIGGHWR